MLENKKFVLIGDRDGVPGESLKNVVSTIAGAEVVLDSTECAVWTAAGSMDLEIQKRIKEFADSVGADNLVVVLGGADAELSGMAAETVVEGDPTYAGALAGVALGLKVYHVAEPEFKALVDEAIFEEEVGMFEMTNDVEEIAKEVSAFRK